MDLRITNIIATLSKPEIVRAIAICDELIQEDLPEILDTRYRHIKTLLLIRYGAIFP